MEKLHENLPSSDTPKDSLEASLARLKESVDALKASYEESQESRNEQEERKAARKAEAFIAACYTALIASMAGAAAFAGYQGKHEKEIAQARAEVKGREMKRFDKEYAEREAVILHAEAPVTYSVTIDSSAPQPSIPYNVEIDHEVALIKFQTLKDAAQRKALNLITNDMSEGEINEWYSEVSNHLDVLVESRKKLANLNFHIVDDPRMRAFLDRTLEIMHLTPQERMEIVRKPLEVRPMEPGEEAVRGQLGRGNEKKITVSSVQLARALDHNDTLHELGIATVANELCHYIRGNQYGSFSGYTSAYAKACQKGEVPPSYVKDSELPKEANAFYDLWMEHSYNGKQKGPQQLVEKESFNVGFRAVEEMHKTPVTIRIHPEDQKTYEIIQGSLAK